MAIVQGPLGISQQGIRIPVPNFSPSTNHISPSNQFPPRRHSLGSSLRTENEYHLDSTLPPLPDSVRSQRRCIVHPFNTQRRPMPPPPPRSITVDVPFKVIGPSSSCPGCRHEALTLPRRIQRDETTSTVLTTADVNMEFSSDFRTNGVRTCSIPPLQFNSLKRVTPV